MSRLVTEYDFRQKEFQHPDIKPEQYEFRADGKLVRKDRWERGFRKLAYLLGYNARGEFEIQDVIEVMKKFIENSNSN